MAHQIARTLIIGALAAVSLGLAASTLRTGRTGEPAPVDSARPVDHISVEHESWSHGNGLLIVSVTFGNANQFALAPVIIACDILKEGAPQGSHGTLIPRIIPPGQTTVEGIEFATFEHGLEGGHCKIVSAARLWTVGPDQSRLESVPHRVPHGDLKNIRS
jgi:hypothetical protein